MLLSLTVGGCVIVPAHGQGKNGGSDTVLLCHKGKKTMELPRGAAAAHIDHGDKYGPC